MVKDFSVEYNIDSLYDLIKSSDDIDVLFERFTWLNKNKNSTYQTYIEKIKVLFVVSSDYAFLSTAALIFNEYRIHSSVHLIVAKLLSGNFDDCGGTFLFSLMGLRTKIFREELRSLWSRDISWEMQQKLEMLNIHRDNPPLVGV